MDYLDDFVKNFSWEEIEDSYFNYEEEIEYLTDDEN